MICHMVKATHRKILRPVSLVLIWGVVYMIKNIALDTLLQRILWGPKYRYLQNIRIKGIVTALTSYAQGFFARQHGTLSADFEFLTVTFVTSL